MQGHLLLLLPPVERQHCSVCAVQLAHHVLRLLLLLRWQQQSLAAAGYAVLLPHQ
jgi:hypothetical protein